MLRISTQKPYFLVPTSQSEICNVRCEISPAAPADLFMRNKANLCVFWAVSGDCEEKQTQFKANQTQFPRPQNAPILKTTAKLKKLSPFYSDSAILIFYF